MQLQEMIDPSCRLPNDLDRVQIYFMVGNEMRVIRGFFFFNGGKPEFAAYGSEITNVVGWKPITDCTPYNCGRITEIVDSR